MQKRLETAAIFDVGKSNVRLYLSDQSGTMLATLQRPNRVVAGPPYPHFDADDLYDWLLDGLSSLARQHEITSIIPVTHGAAAALVEESGGLALPIMDYEFEGVGEFDSEYEPLARNFDRTGSPRLPAGLNLGRQVFWQQRKFPGEFARAAILPCPQYWAHRMTGELAYEVTSLGCHTDLWSPKDNTFSTLTRNMGWDSRFGQRISAWTSLGPLSPSLAAQTGIPAACRVLAGIHDSNASYLAHRALRDDPFCVVSTGTWIVVMAHRAPLERLREDRDMLANVDAFGDAVATARFMGGREYAAIAGDDAPSASPTQDELRGALASGALALPSFSDQGGPFRAHRGRLEGRVPENPRIRHAMAAMYCAMMTDCCIELLDARGDIIVDGPFAANEAYMTVLASLRDPTPVLRATGDSGTVHGAVALWKLARGLTPEAPQLSQRAPLFREEIGRTRERWRALLPAT